MNQLVPFADRAHALVAAAGPRAAYRFLEFFTAQIRNPNTRRAYARGERILRLICDARRTNAATMAIRAGDRARARTSGLPAPIQDQANRGFEPPVFLRGFLAAIELSRYTGRSRRHVRTVFTA
jgi:hypothetical protein